MNNIKQIRESKGMTQKELAEALNIKDVTIARYETNVRQPKLEQLKKIANVLNVSYLDLIDDMEWVAETLETMKSDGLISGFRIDNDRKTVIIDTIRDNKNHGYIFHFDNFKKIKKETLEFMADRIMDHIEYTEKMLNSLEDYHEKKDVSQ